MSSKLSPDQVVLSLAAIAQKSRLAIYRELVQAGPEGMPAGKVSDATDIAPSSLSFHFKELVHAGLVQSRQVGRSVIYTANYSAMNQLLIYLTENCCAGECGPAAKPVKEMS